MDPISEALDRIEQARAIEAEAIECGTALDFLQAVYRDFRQPLPVRLRAAIEALPFESPKLSAVAVMSGEDFGARLDRAIARSQAPMKVIEHRPDETIPPPRWSGPLRGGDE
jgi:hypothetical protein